MKVLPGCHLNLLFHQQSFRLGQRYFLNTNLCFKEWLDRVTAQALGDKGQDKDGSNKNRKEVMVGDTDLTK